MIPSESPKTAQQFFAHGLHILKERGKTYDKAGEERSMAAAVDAFNAITGRVGTERALKEADGWLLMQVLKDVRQWSAPEYHPDSALDGVCYSALKAEALAR